MPTTTHLNLLTAEEFFLLSDPHETATATGEDVLPGFTCRVGDLLP